ncbi:hypothetical protein Trydic_g7021 [Trypoxylus dichotomus]
MLLTLKRKGSYEARSDAVAAPDQRNIAKLTLVEYRTYSFAISHISGEHAKRRTTVVCKNPILCEVRGHHPSAGPSVGSIRLQLGHLIRGSARESSASSGNATPCQNREAVPKLGILPPPPPAS